MEHFVTLFNKNFLPQGLALFTSINRHHENAHLWVLCIDFDTKVILDSFNFPNLSTIDLAEVETPELKKVKSKRSLVEYCWTLSPFAPRFVFEADESIERVTYLDADMFFLKNSKEIFDEFNESQKAVLITEHAYSPEYDQSLLSGRFCIQCMIFRRKEGEVVRKWWEERCIEWCFNKFEEDKFGDQKYLDRWPTIFSKEVHILKNLEWVLAPWNSTRFPHGNAILFHFHGLRMLNNNRINIGNYLLPRVVFTGIYHSYILELTKTIDLLARKGIIIQPQQKISLLSYLKSLLSIFHFNLALYKWQHIFRVKRISE